MDGVHSGNKLISLDFELVTYRKGCLHAYVNLENGYLTWRDSRQWCNNFTRTLSEGQIQTFHQYMDACGLMDQMEPSQSVTEDQACPADSLGTSPGQNSSSWLITALAGDQSYRLGGSGKMPVCAENLRILIEKLCRVSFEI